jgi:hypothetical protein
MEAVSPEITGEGRPDLHKDLSAKASTSSRSQLPPSIPHAADIAATAKSTPNAGPVGAPVWVSLMPRSARIGSTSRFSAVIDTGNDANQRQHADEYQLPQELARGSRAGASAVGGKSCIPYPFLRAALNTVRPCRTKS